MSALATVAGKSFNGKFPAQIGFPLGYFILPPGEPLKWQEGVSGSSMDSQKAP